MITEGRSWGQLLCFLVVKTEPICPAVNPFKYTRQLFFIYSVSSCIGDFPIAMAGSSL